MDRAPQMLIKTRETGGAKQIFASVDCAPYTHFFWTTVAQGLRGRTADDCLDAFLTLNRCPVARFTPPSPAPKLAAAAAAVRPNGPRPPALAPGPLRTT